MAPMATAHILTLKKQLLGAVTANRIEEIKSILSQLKADVIATEALIRETKIGVTVNKLRQNASSEVADLAKEIVRKWKADVGPASNRPVGASKVDKTGSASPHPSAAASPALPASPAVKDASAPVASSSTAMALDTNTPVASSSKSAPLSPAPKPKRRESLNGAARTMKTDAISLSNSKQSTGDTFRNKCVELTYDALASDSDAPSEQILGRACALEEYVFKMNDTAAYRTKMRSFMLNLKAKNNPSLRENVVSGDIAIARLYEMTPAEMASEEQQAANRKLIELNLFNAQGAAPQQAETDAFQCGRCKQRRTMYYQMQTRSADEPMTTFVTCLSCNLRWKFS